MKTAAMTTASETPASGVIAKVTHPNELFVPCK